MTTFAIFRALAAIAIVLSSVPTAKKILDMGEEIEFRLFGYRWNGPFDWVIASGAVLSFVAVIVVGAMVFDWSSVLGTVG